ncbi:MAG: hypothetical protein WKG07_43065 [Hymenobacter sp.]
MAVDQITAANPQLKNGLGIGEVVLVPRGAAGGSVSSKAAAPAPAKTRSLPPATTAPERHTVAKGKRYSALPVVIICRPASSYC